jgi:hypothetical protein
VYCTLLDGWKCYGQKCTCHHQGKIEPNLEVAVYIEVGEGWVWLVMAGDEESRIDRS